MLGLGEHTASNDRNVQRPGRRRSFQDDCLFKGIPFDFCSSPGGKDEMAESILKDKSEMFQSISKDGLDLVLWNPNFRNPKGIIEFWTKVNAISAVHFLLYGKIFSEMLHAMMFDHNRNGESAGWRVLSKGFTIIELLVVIFILAVLTALTFSAAQNAVEQGNRAACLGNLAAVSRGLIHYTLEHNGQFPYTFISNAVTGARTQWSEEVFRGGYTTSVESFLCPSMKYDRAAANINIRSRAAMIQALRFSATSTANNATWAYVSFGANRYGLMPYGSDSSWKRAAITSIANQTKVLMLIEAADQPSFNGWFSVSGASLETMSASTANTSPVADRHNGFANASFVDGHVESLQVRRDLIPRSSNRTNEPWFIGTYTK